RSETIQRYFPAGTAVPLTIASLSVPSNGASQPARSASAARKMNRFMHGRRRQTSCPSPAPVGARNRRRARGAGQGRLMGHPTPARFRPPLASLRSVRLAAAGLDIAPAHSRQRAMPSLIRPPLASLGRAGVVVGATVLDEEEAEGPQVEAV